MKKIIIGIALLFALSLPHVNAAQSSPVTEYPETPANGYGQVKITAMVPLSDLWEEEIAARSRVSLMPDGKGVTVTIIGYQDELMPKQRIRALVTRDGSLSQVFQGETGEDGTAHFVLESQEQGAYNVTVINETYERDVQLQDTLTFTK